MWLLWQGLALRTRLQTRIGAADPVADQARWLRTSTPLLLVSLVSTFYPELCNVVIGTLVAPGDLALFGAAFRTAFLLAFAVMAVDAVTLPRSAQLHSRGRQAELESLVRHATRLRSVASTAGVLFVALTGRFVLRLFGSDFEPAYAALLVLALAVGVRGVLGPGLELLSVTGHQDRSLHLCLLHLLGTLILVPILTTQGGVLGASIGVLIMTLTTGLAALWVVIHQLGIEPCLLRRRATLPAAANDPEGASP